MKPLVLVRSGGDIASGVIYRLKRAGYPVIVNEIAIPTMIRREVSYGNAVHRGEMILERFVARHVSMIEAKNLINTDVIPVVTDAYLDVLQAFKPDVVVDGILATVIMAFKCSKFCNIFCMRYNLPMFAPASPTVTSSGRTLNFSKKIIGVVISL